MNTIFFLTINNTYNYILDNFNMIKPDNFCDSYLNYINGTHVKNGHNMLFSEDYVFSFERNNKYFLYFPAVIFIMIGYIMKNTNYYKNSYNFF